MKKKSLSLDLAALALALLMLGFVSCNNGTESEPTPVADNPASGVFSEESAKAIFDYGTVSGGVRIDKFKNAAALKAYLAAGVSSSVRSLNIAREAGDSGSGATLKLNKIGAAEVVDIGKGAFSPENGAASLADAGVSAIRLPETLKTIAADAFKGAAGVMVHIPETLTNDTAIAEQITAMEEESGVTTESVPDTPVSEPGSPELPASSGTNELAGKKRIYYSSTWTEKIEFSDSEYQKYSRQGFRPGVDWTEDGSSQGYSWDTTAKKVYLKQGDNSYYTYYYTITGDSVWLSMVQDSGSAIGGCAYTAKAESSSGGTHYLLSIGYDTAIGTLKTQLGEPHDGTNWSIQSGSELSATENAVVLEVNDNDIRLAKRENGDYVITPWQISSTNGAIPASSGTNELSDKTYDQSVRINPIQEKMEFSTDGTYTVSRSKNATEFYTSESGEYSWNTTDKTISRQTERRDLLGSGELLDKAGAKAFFESYFAANFEQESLPSGYTMESYINEIVKSYFALKTFYYTISGDSVTLSLLKDSGSAIGGCMYTAKAETSSGIHYLLSISYDEAVAILKRQLGEPQDGTDWSIRSGSELSATENAVVLEVNDNDIRLAKKENGDYVVTPWNF